MQAEIQELYVTRFYTNNSWMQNQEHSKQELSESVTATKF